MKIHKLANMLPPIVAVAIKDEAGKLWVLPKPNRHGDIIKLMRDNGLDGKGECGFIAGGKFLSREEAWRNARANKQILPPYNPMNPNERRWDLEPDSEPRELVSEDIW